MSEGGRPRVGWTREQLLIALNLYYKLPFGRLHRHNPVIVDAAERMRRTPSSLAMKLCNFASLDPVQKARGVKGLRGASRKDAAIWEELRNDLDRLGPESEQLVHDLFTDDPAADVDVVSGDHVRVGPPRGPTQRRSLVTVRRGQQFFRQTVLAAYEVRCCITGIALPELLVASHILPWRDFPEQRLNPANGLCLSRLHDGAFDSGLITLDEDLRVVLGRAIRERLPQPALETSFVAYEGRPIVVSSKIAEPDGAFLEYHREHVFRG